MKKKQYTIGQKFGNWTILETEAHGRPAKIKVLCSCNKEFVKNAYSITSGKSKSCGCINTGSNASNWQGIGNVPKSSVTREFKRVARIAPVKLDYNEAVSVYISQNGTCAVTGQPLDMKNASLARLTPDTSYTSDNTCWVDSSLRGFVDQKSISGVVEVSKTLLNNSRTLNTLEALGFTKKET